MVLSGELKGTQSADVVVVGSGIAGISSAYHLEKAGFEVVVLEEAVLTSGATNFSSGVLYFGSGTNFQEAIAMWGVDVAKAFWDETKKSIDDIVGLVKANNWDAGLHSPGALIVAMDALQTAYLEGELSAMSALGYPGKMVSSAEMREMFSGREFACGLFQPICHQINPWEFVPLMAKSLKARVFEKSGMKSIDETPSGVVVNTGGGSVSAKHVVIATNLAPTYGGLDKHFSSESSVHVPSEPLPVAELGALWPKDGIIWTAAEKYDLFYLHGNTVHFEVYNLKGVKDKMKFYFPESVKFRLDKATGDSWAKTRDWLPIVGSIKPRVHAAVAMGDQGIIIGWTSGKHIAELVQGRMTLFLEMSNPKRF